MPVGFFITGLQASGRGLRAADISFSRGGNVVSGASNTGKSYLLDCIDYMFGRQDVPRVIPEGSEYSSLLLGIETFDGVPLTLERSLLGGNFLVHPLPMSEVGARAPAQYSARKRKGRDDSISVLLLGLSGLQNRKVLQKQRGETRDLSFRDVSRLILVDEERIIQKRSPVRSGDSNLESAEDALFRMLIMGADYMRDRLASSIRVIRRAFYAAAAMG